MASLLTLADGQLPAVAASLYAPTDVSLRVNLTALNTSASLTETVTITFQRAGGTARRVARATLLPNEQLIVSGLPVQQGDTLLGLTSDAATVDYVVSASGDYALTIATLDSTGSVKSSSILSGSSVAGNLTIGGLLLESFAVISAGTTRTQTGATPTTKQDTRVDTSTSTAAGSTLGDGVALMAAAGGLDQTVHNNTANTIQVYGILGGTDTINGVAGATGVPLPPGDVAQFESMGAGVWGYEAGVGSAGPLDTQLACDNITATGGGQAGAFQLVASENRILTATAGQGVALPVGKQGLDCTILNHTGVSIIVYGNNANGDTVDDIPTATGLSVMDSSEVVFKCYATTVPAKWYTIGAGGGYAKNQTAGVVLATIPYADNLTALGSSQATGLQLTAAMNTFGTAAAGTGCNLSTSAPGLQQVITNNGANALQVYPVIGGSETINGLAAAVGVSLHQGTSATFNCTAAGAWTVAPASPKLAAFNTDSGAGSHTLTAANITGGVASVDLAMTGAAGAGVNATLPTVTALVAALHAPTVGTSYRLRIINEGNASTVWTVLTATGWTLTGTMTIALNTWRDFDVTLNTLTTATLQNAGTGTFS